MSEVRRDCSESASSFSYLLILAATVDDDLAFDRCAGGVVDVDLAAATTESLAGVIDCVFFFSVSGLDSVRLVRFPGTLPSVRRKDFDDSYAPSFYQGNSPLSRFMFV